MTILCGIDCCFERFKNSWASGSIIRWHLDAECLEAAFYSLDDFSKQLSAHNRRSNNLPMRSLRRLSPAEFTVQYVWQTYIFVWWLENKKRVRFRVEWNFTLFNITIELLPFFSPYHGLCRLYHVDWSGCSCAWTVLALRSDLQTAPC